MTERLWKPNHPKHSQLFQPLQSRKAAKEQVARKGSHESHGPFHFLEISTFSLTVSLKLRKLCKLPQVYFKDFYEGKFNNHQSTPNNVHNHKGLTVYIHSNYLLPPYSFSLIIWLPTLTTLNETTLNMNSSLGFWLYQLNLWTC